MTPMGELIAPILTAVVGAALSALIAYPLGRTQGKQQTLHQEQVKVIAEIRRLLLEADEALWLAAMRPDDEDFRDGMFGKIARLGQYHREKDIWLDRNLNDKISAIADGYMEQASKLFDASSQSEAFELEEHRASEEVNRWAYTDDCWWLRWRPRPEGC